MNPDVILFDLGGVLVELSGVPVMHRWSNNRFDDDMLWEAWLHSPSVRAFETGKISADQFADEIVDEMALTISAGEFIEAFTHWPTGLYSGTIELLSTLRSNNQRLACLSNSNELHWPRLMNEMGLATLMDEHYASHEIGMLKPDADVFVHVLEELGCGAESVLFLDDNNLNVEAARTAGLQAFRAKGILEVHSVLRSQGINSQGIKSQAINLE
jgi:putative hydrolase of the HAD superfamily